MMITLGNYGKSSYKHFLVSIPYTYQSAKSQANKLVDFFSLGACLSSTCVSYSLFKIVQLALLQTQVNSLALHLFLKNCIGCLLNIAQFSKLLPWFTRSSLRSSTGLWSLSPVLQLWLQHQKVSKCWKTHDCSKIVAINSQVH